MKICVISRKLQSQMGLSSGILTHLGFASLVFARVPGAACFFSCAIWKIVEWYVTVWHDNTIFLPGVGGVKQSRSIALQPRMGIFA
ncbi:hypothetical protein BD779DRAFT_125425 [Infundibulicybe gibba]|nr:hypothetical protein BD779DRAFT_125425 [Infundibulicybe gibba]